MSVNKSEVNNKKNNVIILVTSVILLMMLVFLPYKENIVNTIKSSVGVGVGFDSEVTVYLYVNGGTVDENHPSYCDYEEEDDVVYFLTYKEKDIVLPTKEEITKEGYTFVGWYEESDFSGEVITEYKNISENHEVYAKWEKDEPENSNIKIVDIDGVIGKKTVYWTTYNGESTDSKGNPYIKVEFLFDCSVLDYSKYEGKIIQIEDYVPLEYTVLEETIKIEDSICGTTESGFIKENNTVTAFWDNDNSFLGTPSIYEFGFIMTLNLDKIDLKKIKETGYIYTNGNSIYEETKESAKIDTNILEEVMYIPSAKLEYVVEDVVSDGKISTVSTLKNGIELSKKASWTVYNDSPVDASGNPYVKIEFTVDPSERYATSENNYLVNPSSESEDVTEEGKFVIQSAVPTLCDIIPNEFTVIEESISCNDEAIYTAVFKENDNMNFWTSFDKGIENKVYDISFVAVLDKNKLSEECLTGEKSINTNGITIDSSVDSKGSSYLEEDGEKIELESPSLDYTKIKTECAVVLHTSGGILASGKDITKHIVGKETVLPTEADITKDGYTFVGWYDNPSFNGEPIKVIPAGTLNDMEYWARWGKLEVSKSAQWTQYMGEGADINGNPFIKTEFEIDLSNAAVDVLYKKNAKVDIAIVLDFSTSLSTETGLIDELGNELTGIDIQREEIKKYVKTVLEKNPNARFWIAGFADTMWEIATNSNDIEYIYKQLDDVCAQRLNSKNVNGTNIQNALVWTQRQLKDNVSDKKVLIMLTDGLPSTSKSKIESIDGSNITAYSKDILKGDDVLSKNSKFYLDNQQGYVWYDYDRYAGYTLMPEELQKLTIAQAEYLKQQVKGINIIPIGVNLVNLKTYGTEANDTLYKVGDNVLNSMSTLNLGNGTNYYATEISSTTLGTEYVGEILDKCVNSLNVKESINLVDYIPKNYELLKDTIEVSDKNINYNVTEYGIEFDFNSVDVKNTKYYVSFKTKLDMESSIDVINNNSGRFYTNGTTIDVSANADKSACFELGDLEKNKVYLKSPILSLDTDYSVTLHTNGGALLEGKNITSYSYGQSIILPNKDEIHMEESVFIGWYDNELLQGEPVISIKPTDRGDKEFWAKWEHNIQKTEGEITLTKSASWTTMDGEYTDENGNPYAKIEFTVDLTKSNIGDDNANGSPAMATDIVLLLDFSKPMEKSSGTKDAAGRDLTGLDVELNAALEFLDTILKDRNDTRVAVAGFADTMWPIVELESSKSSDYEALKSEIIRVFNARKSKNPSRLNGTDIKNGIIWTQNQFKNSNADNKILTVLADGIPEVNNAGNAAYVSGVTNTRDEAGDDVTSNSTFYNNNSSKYNIQYTLPRCNAKAQMEALVQSDYLKHLVPGINVIALGLNMRLQGNAGYNIGYNILTNLATKNLEGDLMFYETSTDAADNMKFLSEAFKDIAVEVQKIQNNLKVFDTVPKEYDILADSIVCEENVVIYVDDETGMLSFDFSEVTLENKVYVITFYIKLDVTKIPEELRGSYETLNTNGTSIDPSVDSTGSSYIEYGEDKIELESPKVEGKIMYKVTLHSMGGTILAGSKISSYIAGEGAQLPSSGEIYRQGYKFKGWYNNAACIGQPIMFISSSELGDKEYWAKWEKESIINVSKSAKWAKIDGERTNQLGDPYVQIRFDIDMTQMVASQHFATEEETMDIVVLLDYSQNLWSSQDSVAQKEAAKLFIENILYTTDRTRVAVGIYGDGVDKVASLDDAIATKASDIATLLDAKHTSYYNDYLNTGGMESDMQSAIIWAQRELVNSSADRKMIVLFADGEPTKCNSSDIYQGADVQNIYNDINSCERTVEVKKQMNDQTLKQMETAKSLINDLHVMTINFNVNEIGEGAEKRFRKLLFDMASLDVDDNKLYKEAIIKEDVVRPITLDGYNQPKERGVSIASSNTQEDIIVSEVFDNKNRLVTIMIQDIMMSKNDHLSFNLVDYIPYEYSLLTDTIVKSDSSIINEISNNKVVFKFPYNKVKKKKYIIIFNTVLLTNRISRDVLQNNKTIYTNGNTIDVRNSSHGSAYLECGVDKILLDSPVLELEQTRNVILHTNGGSISSGKDVISYKEGVGVVLPDERHVYKEGMTFIGWYDNELLQGEPITRILPDDRGDKEYWASWQVNGYKVTLYPNGGTVEEGSNITGYVYGIPKDLPTSEDIYRPGYDFVGWYSNPSYRGNVVTEISAGSVGHQKFWARWEPITHTVLNGEKLIYTAVGYKDLYATENLDISVMNRSGEVLTAFLTRTESVNSRKISDICTYYSGQENYMVIPQGILKGIVESRGEQYIYLQILKGEDIIRTERIRMKYCTSFVMH